MIRIKEMDDSDHDMNEKIRFVSATLIRITGKHDLNHGGSSFE